MNISCKQCGVDFEAIGAYASRTKYCSDSCHAAYDDGVQKEKATKKRNILNRFKRMKGCIDCGYKTDYRALEFDHKEGLEKLRTVASYTYHSRKKIKAELSKCVVRCCNCHAIVTHERGQYIHSTPS